MGRGRRSACKRAGTAWFRENGHRPNPAVFLGRGCRSALSSRWREMLDAYTGGGYRRTLTYFSVEEADRQKLRRAKIASASRRERVCQYVETTGVEVPLKNQQQGPMRETETT